MSTALPARKLNEVGKGPLFRRAYGRDISRVCGGLAAWKARPSDMTVYVPGQDTDRVNTRLEIIQETELGAAPGSRLPAQIRTPRVQAELRRRVPSLARPQKVGAVAIELDVPPPRIAGYYFFNLKLVYADNMAAQRERRDTRAEFVALTNPSPEELAWREPRIEIPLVRIGPESASEEFVEGMGTFLSNKLGLPQWPKQAEQPIDLVLGPAEFLTPAEPPAH